MPRGSCESSKLATSGNSAFDEYRAETLRRLEDEQKEFREFLDRLRQAKDKSEFDQFMTDRSRRPHRSPARTPDPVEQLVLAVRDRFGWGARRVHAFLASQGIDVPSCRTVHAILCRHGRIPTSQSSSSSSADH